MELKHRYGYTDSNGFFPLIVPYGIETRISELTKKMDVNPLIVPYGIET